MDALRIVRKGMLSFTVGNLVVTRIDVNIIFKVEHKHSHSTGRRLLIDPAGNPILTLPRSNNTTENAPDLKIKGSWLQRSCVIYAGKSSTIVAQMHKKQTANLFAKDTFIVTISPGIDYAFIVALIVILDAINLDNGD
ncbi:PREDICTED: LURP-one-related [Prunus dulcis]|uniref:PREDICTED: LURP-one-related n=1 Tax=Prunus dulcis TaxID=3755 RepID=A0A5E4EF85_PRUDU|nr:PREDICTED: LURP-one-related [Prunus dulcis]